MFQSQWDTALGLLQEAGRHDRALTQANRYRLKALLARASANPFEERPALLRLIGLQPRCKDRIYQLGESYFHTADADQAIEQYQRVIEIDAAYALAYNHLGYCYAWKGEHERAVAQMQKYFDLHKSGNASDSLGDAYMMRGDYARAIEAKQQALRMDPSLYFAVRSLAYLDLFRGRYRAAATTIDTALSKVASDDQKSRLLASLAFLFYRQGRFEQALDACARGLDSPPRGVARQARAGASCGRASCDGEQLQAGLQTLAAPQCGLRRRRPAPRISHEGARGAFRQPGQTGLLGHAVRCGVLPHGDGPAGPDVGANRGGGALATNGRSGPPRSTLRCRPVRSGVFLCRMSHCVSASGAPVLPSPRSGRVRFSGQAFIPTCRAAVQS